MVSLLTVPVGVREGEGVSSGRARLATTRRAWGASEDNMLMSLLHRVRKLEDWKGGNAQGQGPWFPEPCEDEEDEDAPGRFWNSARQHSRCDQGLGR